VNPSNRSRDRRPWAVVTKLAGYGEHKLRSPRSSPSCSPASSRPAGAGLAELVAAVVPEFRGRSRHENWCAGAWDRVRVGVCFAVEVPVRCGARVRLPWGRLFVLFSVLSPFRRCRLRVNSVLFDCGVDRRMIVCVVSL
jgi:hypothetical protein